MFLRRTRKPFTAKLPFLFTSLALLLLILPPDESRAFSNNITNPSFETGDLTGWTATGAAFSNGDVASDTNYWNLQKFNQSHSWHLYGGKGDNTKTGVLKSETFTVGEGGQINLLVGGNNDINNLYVALVRDSDGAELLKATGPGSDTYSRINWDASAFVGTVVYIKIVDNSATGHINLDDINVPPSASLHGHIDPALYNHDFEYHGIDDTENKGWTVVSGDAFAPSSVVHDDTYSAGGKFNKAGTYHLWNFKDGGDGQVGELKSEVFTLGGNGGIDFLIGGGKDINNLYVGLYKASDNSLIFKETGLNSEGLRRVFWDASAYIGQDLYIKIVDNSTGSFGHINADDFHVLNSVYAGGLFGYWKLDETSGANAAESVTGTTDPVAYHLNTGVNQPAQNPLWRSDGINNGALLFDGYSNYITRTPDKTPIPTNKITVEAWVAPRTFESDPEGRLSAIVNQHNREAKEGFILGVYRHGTWGFQFGTGTSWHEVMTDTQLPLNEWTYMTATYDSSTGEAVLYQNGKKVTSEIFAAEPIVPSATDLLIGRNNQSHWEYYWQHNNYSGLLDELKIRNTKLDAATVQSNYDSSVNAHGGNLPTADLRMDRSILANDSQRPQFHAEPPDHWQNEPGGPIYFNGQYHVFYQSNPQGPYWDNIRWGHLVSTDMVHWRDAVDAVIPGRSDIDADGAWAGGSTIDGNGAPAIVYTAGYPGKDQVVNIARSTFLQDGDNDLNRWVKNPTPVAQRPTNEGRENEFRDPFVFKDGDEWFMLVTSGKLDANNNKVGGTALVYSTTDKDLNNWTFRGDLYDGNSTTYPMTGNVWELPNLLPLYDINGVSTGKHIFIINPADLPDGYKENQSRNTYYWIGTFNKTTAKFEPDDPTPQKLDVGQHFTGPAGMVTPDNRTVIFSIAQGRRSSEMDYDAGYAHSYGTPLRVYLRSDGKLGMEPISELQSLRGTQLVNITTDTSFAAANTTLSTLNADMYDIEAEIDPGSANEVGFSLLRSPDAQEETIVYHKRSSQELWVNRTKTSKDVDIEKWFYGGPANIGTDTIKLHILVDRSLIEAYLNGIQSLTTRAYPSLRDANGNQVSKGIQLWANGNSNTVTVKSLKIWAMNSAYPTVNPTGVTINPPAKQIIVGDSELLTANVAPSNASNKDIIWTSSNTSVATIVNGRVTAKATGTATITAKTRVGNFTGTSTITVVAATSSGSLTNHDFESGNLSGWSIVSGTAFSAADVTNVNDWGWGGPFNQNGSYHLWSAKSGLDTDTGTMKSDNFALGGNGQIDFLVGGGNDIYNLYVTLVRASDEKELFKASGGGFEREAYTRIYWDASEYIGTECYIKVVDNSTGAWGHINIDDVNVPVHQNTNTNIVNPDFETGNLSGWTTVSGNAFNSLDVSKDTTFWNPPQSFNQHGTFHLWGFKNGGDGQVGTIKSTTFTLAGSGWVDFLIGGGNDINNLYVSLVRASDGAELYKATGNNSEAYSRIEWNASAYLGQQVYIKIVDNATGGWGHINADDFHVLR